MAINNSLNYQPTQYNVITGGASNTINNVAPSATSGVPLISGGSSAQPSFGTAVVAGGGTGITSATAYAPICAGTSTTGAFQVASTGLSSSGYVFTSNGSSALPSWNASSSTGNWVLIQSQTASNVASISFTTGITSTYNTYIFVISNVNPITSADALQVLVSVNGGSSYVNSGYAAGANYIAYNASSLNATNATARILLSSNMVTTTTSPYSAVLWFFDVSNGNTCTCRWNSTYFDSGTTNAWSFSLGGGSTAQNTVNAFQFSMAGGHNINQGIFTLYGLVE